MISIWPKILKRVFFFFFSDHAIQIFGPVLWQTLSESMRNSVSANYLCKQFKHKLIQVVSELVFDLKKVNENYYLKYHWANFEVNCLLRPDLRSREETLLSIIN